MLLRTNRTIAAIPSVEGDGFRVARRPNKSADWKIAGWAERKGIPSKPLYSVRRADMGEMEAARPAGMMAARNAKIARAVVATRSAGGSQLETP